MKKRETHCCCNADAAGSCFLLLGSVDMPYTVAAAAWPAPDVVCTAGMDQLWHRESEHMHDLVKTLTGDGT